MKLNDVLRVANAAGRAAQGRPEYRRRRPGRKSGAALIAAALTALVAWWQTKSGGGGTSTPSAPTGTNTSQRSGPPSSNAGTTASKTLGTSTGSNRPGAEAQQLPKDGERAILDAYKAQRSDFWATVSGEVVKVLPDDREGDMHQKFLLELPSGHTLLIAHNIDLAPRVPVKEGDAVTLKGEYEWKDQGGVMHWTHHDPGGRRPGGWIEHAGKKYE